MDERRGRVYRLHQLFSEFLNQRYREEFSEPQHRYYMARAGHVLAEEGYWEEALNCHLQARQFDAAAAVIKRLAPDLESTGRYIELGRWLEGLPDKLVESDPWLHYYLCQSRRWSGLRQNLKVLPKVLEDFRRAGDDRGAHGGPDRPDLRRLHRRAALVHDQGLPGRGRIPGWPRSTRKNSGPSAPPCSANWDSPTRCGAWPARRPGPASRPT